MRAVNKRTGIKVGERLCFCWFKTKLLRVFFFFFFFFFSFLLFSFPLVNVGGMACWLTLSIGSCVILPKLRHFAKEDFFKSRLMTGYWN